MINLATTVPVHIDWAAAITASGVAIVAIGGAVTGVIVAISSARKEAKAANAVALKTAAEMAKKTKRIEASVNGNASTAAARIKQVEDQLAALHERMLKLQDDRLDAANQRAARAEGREDAAPTE